MQSDEPVTRYLLQKDHFNRQRGYAKARAFLPPADGKTSVYRIQGLKDCEVWSLGRDNVASSRGRELLGRADLLCRQVNERGLAVIADPPPPRHANIEGWPEKAQQMSIAQRLAADAKLVVIEEREGIGG